MSRGGYVLDASALLCLFFSEPGAERFEAVMPGAQIGAANLAEVIAKLVDRGVDGTAVVAEIGEVDLEVVPLDRAQAEAAGLLRSVTREAGLCSATGAASPLPRQAAPPPSPRIGHGSGWMAWDQSRSFVEQPPA